MKTTPCIFCGKETEHDQIACQECLNEIEKKPKVGTKQHNKELYKEFDEANKESKEKKKQELKQTMLMKLASRRRNEAINEFVELIKNKNTIYTIRSDLKTEIWIYKEGILVPEGRTYIKEYIREITTEAYTTTLANEVISKIEVDTYIDEEEFFKTPNTKEIAVENGILNLKTKELTQFNPNKIFFTKINANYKPNIDCPKIKTFLKETLKNEEDIKIIQELFGFILYPNYFIPKAFMFLGTGSNGKSIIQQLIKKLVTSKNCANISLQKLEEDEFIVSELHNKLVNLGGEINNTSLKETDKFKSLTTKDMITANRKFLRPINFVNYAKLIFNANQLPRTYDTEFAFFRRWIILDFIYTFLPKKEYEKRKEEPNIKLANTELIEEITTKEEMSGLLNYALEGLNRLLKQKEFSYSKTTNEIQQKWIRNSDSFSAFMEDCIIEEWEGKISKADLRKAYANYCRTHKLKGTSDKSIKIHLDNIGVSDERIGYNNESYWVGISFKENYENIIKRQEGQDRHLFLPYREISKIPIGLKSMSKLSKLSANQKEENNVSKIENFVCSKKDFIFHEVLQFCVNNDIDTNLINTVIQKSLSKGDIIEIKPDHYKRV